MNFTSSSWAVKYRPTKLDTVVGHKEAVAAIRGWLARKELPAAVLFSGPSGVGKTTLSRLLARYVNCETGDACGVCDSCQYSTEDHPDYTEINVADQRGIDDVRSLIQQAQFKPRFNMRVLTLDECHQFTTQAFNALLKPVEQPPANTLWVFATTEAHKLPKTLVSRCQVFNLPLIGKAEIRQRLWQIWRRESPARLDKETLVSVFDLIVEASGGHLRDAVNLLESLIRTSESVQFAWEDAKEVRRFVRSHLHTAVQSHTTDELALTILTGIYTQDTQKILQGILYTQDYIPLVNRLIQINDYLIMSAVEKDHASIWHTAINRKAASQLGTPDNRFLVHHGLVNLRMEMQSFAVQERYLLTARLTAIN